MSPTCGATALAAAPIGGPDERMVVDRLPTFLKGLATNGWPDLEIGGPGSLWCSHHKAAVRAIVTPGKPDLPPWYAS